MQTSIIMPQLGESVTEGTIDRWLKREGELVQQDEPLVEVVTDKVNAEVPSPVTGTLTTILVAAGRTVPCRTEIARIETAEDEAAPITEPPAAATPVADAATAPTAPGAPTPAGPQPTSTPHPASSPRPHDESPPLPAPAQAASEVAAGSDELVPLTPARRAIAEHMLHSIHTAPQATMAVEIDLTAVARLRERQRDAFRRRHGVELSYLPFMLQAVAAALPRHPLLNATWTDDGIRLQGAVHLGLAVAVPAPDERIGGDRLLVPVIRHADRLSLQGLALAAAELVERARSGALRPDELRGATFTVNNTGALGSILSMPILPVGQAGILTLEAVVKRAVALADADGGDRLAIRRMAWSCLTFDQRILDDPDAARFLQAVKQYLEEAGLDLIREGR